LPGYDKAKGFLFCQGERCIVVRRMQHAPIFVPKDTRQHGLHFWVSIDDQDRPFWQGAHLHTWAAGYGKPQPTGLNPLTEILGRASGYFNRANALTCPLTTPKMLPNGPGA
jgi:hypothetical protein